MQTVINKKVNYSTINKKKKKPNTTNGTREYIRNSNAVKVSRLYTTVQ